MANPKCTLRFNNNVRVKLATQDTDHHLDYHLFPPAISPFSQPSPLTTQVFHVPSLMSRSLNTSTIKSIITADPRSLSLIALQVVRNLKVRQPDQKFLLSKITLNPVLYYQHIFHVPSLMSRSLNTSTTKSMITADPCSLSLIALQVVRNLKVRQPDQKFLLSKITLNPVLYYQHI